jgi:D-inositol-3-phosphate glycosyltransferase
MTDSTSNAAPEPDPSRVAVLSLHSSPLDQPGSGDSGGMNVYVMAVARRLSEQGIDVDIYTRSDGEDRPVVQDLGPRSRLIQVEAGPRAPVPKEELPDLVPDFTRGVLTHAEAESDRGPHRHSPYDVVHSHYWLSGWVGARAKEIWGVPHVASFHTLGKVKNHSLGNGDAPEPAVRLDGEEHVVAGADRILAPTAGEAADLVSLYGADPSRIRVVTPGVDPVVFSPRSRASARSRLHLSNARLLLFVGRLQPFKGPDVAIRALADAILRAPDVTRDVLLAVVGGSAGADGEQDQVTRLMRLATEAGVGDRVVFFPPQPHERLADFYRASEAVIVPSRWESFGLVALEAQACGTPVIAAAAGGLRDVVVDGVTGLLVEGHEPAAYAQAILGLLSDRRTASRMGRAAARHAVRFSWDATAAGIRDVYRELVGRRAG